MATREGFAATRVAPFSIRVVADDERTIRLIVRGELDLSTTPRLDDSIQRELSGTRDVLLDLSGVQFIDSSGLHTILRAVWESRASGKQLTLSSSLPLQARRLFEVVGVLDELPLVDR